MLCSSTRTSHVSCVYIQGGRGKGKGERRSEGMKEVLESLPTLWDEEQYKSEYDLSTFMNSLSAAK